MLHLIWEYMILIVGVKVKIYANPCTDIPHVDEHNNAPKIKRYILQKKMLT